MNPVQDIISDIEAMRSSMGDNWFGPFSNECDGHIEWPNLSISLNNLKSMPHHDAATIIDKLCPVIASVAGMHVSPKLSHELTIRLNDILTGATEVQKDAKEVEITGTTSVARA
jgi:hypothetical protein